jgi:flagellar biogenesis protein FliO
MIWVKLIIVLAFFLIMPYLYVKFVEGRLKSFIEKIWRRVSFEFSRKFQWL